MSNRSRIEWTDATWNPVTGCTKVSPGCQNCYAERMAGRFSRTWTSVRCHEDRLGVPLRWRRPRMVFVCSMGDLFHDEVPDEFIRRVFDTMATSSRHTFQVLTKRPERMRALVPTFADRHTAQDGSGWPLPNVWIGVTAEDRERADERVLLLLQTPAAVRYVSLEPLLGPVRLTDIVNARGDSTDALRGETCSYESGCICEEPPSLDWVIVGGESGPRARSCNTAWIRSVLEQCKAAAVPCFVKQLGSHWARWVQDVYRPNSKGGDPSEWPEDLRVREFPKLEAK